MLEIDLPLDFDPAVDAELRKMHWSRHNGVVTMLLCSPASDTKWYGEEILNAYPHLRVLATASTGTNHIDLAACAERGIKVISLLDDREGLNTISASAEWTFKLVLEGLRLKRPYHELQGSTVGLVGFGRIGRKVYGWCQGFGADVTWTDDATHGTLISLFRRCDVVVICCTLNEQTTGMVNYDLLRRLPPEAVLVNTARGEVINEPDLCRFMAERPDVRVCLDVVTGEVDGTANPERLRQLGAYVSDHIAGETYESRTKAARIILELLKKEKVAA